ncbi:hypothetical protein CHS0354_026519 [Potamilus streckersoni]|uniref:E3 ubiquitin-protein ligase n=1 Tax=Potamilus streckersoni TaxID=2493646 RepID=A0AAE0RQ38_9BIVA|nr:hypothetical protein CHS0354_026519 [Potamilus streckersoni]
MNSSKPDLADTAADSGGAGLSSGIEKSSSEGYRMEKNDSPNDRNLSPPLLHSQLEGTKTVEDTLDASVHSAAEETPEEKDREKSIQGYDCAVCLQGCSYPVQLPCKHIFCFLCVKGVAQRSKRCALCRQEIPPDFFDDPKLMSKESLQAALFDEGYQWFYEGRNGWWQYEERTSQELEAQHKKGEKQFELLIAGFLYVIDLENMIQFRRNDRTRRRRIRRDLHNISGIKGVAGIKYQENSTSSRSGGDGGESQTPSVNNGTNILNTQSVGLQMVGDSMNQGLGDDTYLSPPAPNNTPQTPQTPADSPPNSVSNSEQDLSRHLQNLQLDDDTFAPDSGPASLVMRRSLPRYRNSSESDGDYQ